MSKPWSATLRDLIQAYGLNEVRAEVERIGKQNQRSLEEDFEIISGLGPGGTLNYAYADGYFWTDIKVRHQLSEEEAKKLYTNFRRRRVVELDALK